MLAPEIAYQFRLAKDTASTMIEEVFVSNETSLANVVVNNRVYTVPSDRILILTSVMGALEAGAAQIPYRLNIQLERNGLARKLFVKYRHTDPAIDPLPARLGLNVPCEIWLHPGWSINVYGVYSAGAAANITEGCITGILIPRGNIS